MEGYYYGRELSLFHSRVGIGCVIVVTGVGGCVGGCADGAAEEGEDLTYRIGAWLAATAWMVAIGAKKIARDAAADAEKAKAGKAL